MGDIVYPRLTCSLWGDRATGKSHFALTFPDPMVAIEIGETGLGDLVPKFQVMGKVIDYQPVRVATLEPGPIQLRQLLNKFADVYLKAINSEGVKTIVIDSMSRLWSHIQTVKLDEVRSKRKEGAKESQMDWAAVNDYHEQIVNVAAVNPNINLVLLHRHKDVYGRTDSGAFAPTGEIEARDYKQLENLVQVVVRTDYKQVVVPGSTPLRREPHFVHTIEKCRFNMAMQGWEEQDMDYTKLAELVWG